jgi:thioesterase domain-containing protein
MKLEELENYILKNVPITNHIGVKVKECSLNQVVLTAPLNNNSNHVGTAFGGSLTAIQALCCWAWLTNFIDENKLNATVVIQESHSKYKSPVKEDLKAICLSPGEENIQKFLETFRKKSKARLILRSEIYSGGKLAVNFEGFYVGIENT